MRDSVPQFGSKDSLHPTPHSFSKPPHNKSKWIHKLNTTMRLSFAAFLTSAIIAPASAGNKVDYYHPSDTAAGSTMGGSSMMSESSMSSSSFGSSSQAAGVPMANGSPRSTVSPTQLLTEASVCGSQGRNAISNTQGLNIREMALGEAGLDISFQVSPDGNVLFVDLNSPSQPFSAAALSIAYSPET